MFRQLKNLMNWTLKWAESPYGTLALFIIAFAESSFFPIPPDILLIVLCLGRPGRAFFYSAVCTAGSVLGGILGYFIGYSFWALSSSFFFKYVPGFTPELFGHVQELYRQNAFWAVFTAGFTPIPYKVFTIAGGVFGIGLPVLISASAVSRALRFFLVGTLIWKFGKPIKIFIDKYFNLLTIVFTVLLVGGFVVIKYLVKH